MDFNKLLYDHQVAVMRAANGARGATLQQDQAQLCQLTRKIVTARLRLEVAQYPAISSACEPASATTAPAHPIPTF